MHPKLTLASICSRPGIQDCVHGSGLPEEVLYWSEHPEDTQHSFTALGFWHRARSSTISSGDPVVTPNGRVLEFKCRATACHDGILPFQMCHLETTGEQTAKLRYPQFGLGCETTYERYV
jgi:hypothetical protein